MHPIQSVKETIHGKFNNTMMTKEEAENTRGIYRASVEQIVQTSQLKTAKNAANKFKRTPIYAATLIESTLKMLHASQAEGAEKYPNLKLNELMLSDELALAEDSPLAIELKAYNDNAAQLMTFDTKTLDQLKQPLQKAIEKQHAQDIKKIEELFKNSNFTNGHETPPVAKVKDTLLDALEQAKKEKIAELEKDLKPDPVRVLKYYQQAESRILLLASLAENSRHQAFFDKLEQEKQKNNEGSLMITSNDDYEPSKYADADLDQLMDIYTSSGKRLEIAENQIKLQSSVFGFGITSKDSLQLALYGKAKGWEKITFTVEHTDPQKLIILEQNAARAALKAGFDPDKITIKTKDREGKIISKTAQEILGGEAVETLLRSTVTNSTQEYKANIQDVRENAPETTPPLAENNNKSEVQHPNGTTDDTAQNLTNKV